MFADRRIYVGTVGEGLWRSTDAGSTFTRICSGMFMELDVRALAVHPQNRDILFQGTNAGLYKSVDAGDHWQRLETPFDPGNGWPGGVIIWSLAIDPIAPETIYAGVCPSGVYKSTDGGDTWRRLQPELDPDCAPIRYSRVTTLLPDPEESGSLWVGVEIDGIRRTRDGGESWDRPEKGLSSADIHSMAIVPAVADRPRTVLASTNNDLNLSNDEGATWRPLGAKNLFPWHYCRGLVQKADDPFTLFLGNGNGPPGSSGAIQISRDGGETWQAARLSVDPNSTVWNFAVTPASPGDIASSTVAGQLYLSGDGGANWFIAARQFGEIRALAIT